MVLTVQSIRFSKDKYKTLNEAKKEAKKRGYKISVKPNPQYLNYYAFRQIQPSLFIKDSFRVKKIDNGAVLLILGKLKK